MAESLRTATEAALSDGVQTPGQAQGVVLASDGRPVLSQPFLFDDSELPFRPDLVKRAKSFVHTGKIIEKDDELVQAICEALVLGKSLRGIARDYHVSRNTLAHIREELETAGKLEPHKQRMSKKLGRLSEATLDDLIQKAEMGTLPANIATITLGVSIDKKGQLDAGIVPGTEQREPDLDPEALRQRWAKIKAAKVIDVQPVESQSVGNPTPPA
jgi:hypothetical protein